MHTEWQENDTLIIDSIAALEAIYRDLPTPASTAKETDRLTDAYRRLTYENLKTSIGDRLAKGAIEIGIAGDVGSFQVDQATLDAAGKMLTEVIKPLRREAGEVFDPIIASAHKAHRDALAGKARVEKPLIEAEGILKTSVGTYLEQQERIRRAEGAGRFRRA